MGRCAGVLVAGGQEWQGKCGVAMATGATTSSAPGGPEAAPNVRFLGDQVAADPATYLDIADLAISDQTRYMESHTLSF